MAICAYYPSVPIILTLDVIIDALVHYRLIVGAPLQVRPSNNGTMQPTGAIYTCHLEDTDDDKCSILNHTAFYMFGM